MIAPAPWRSRRTSCITPSSRCTPSVARSTTCAPRSPRAWARRGAEPRRVASELRHERSVQLRGVADVGEAEVLEVFARDATDVLRRDALQLLHEPIRVAIVAGEHLCPGQYVGLVGVCLVLQVVL